MNARTLSESCLALAGATLAALLLAAPAGAQVRRIEKHFIVDDKPVVILQNPSGRIQVKAWDKHEVMIVAQSASDKVEVDTEQVDNRIDVTTQVIGKSSAPADLNADLTVTVPTETELQVHTDSGNVTIDSVHGNMSFDTVAADLFLQDVRRLRGHQEPGRLGNLHALRGPPGRQLHQRQRAAHSTCHGQRAACKPPPATSSSTAASSAAAFTSSRTTAAPSKSASPKATPSTSAPRSLFGHVVNQAPVVPDRHNMRAPNSRMSESLFGSVNDGHAKVELSSFSGTIKILKRE